MTYVLGVLTQKDPNKLLMASCQVSLKFPGGYGFYFLFLFSRWTIAVLNKDKINNATQIKVSSFKNKKILFPSSLVFTILLF